MIEFVDEQPRESSTVEFVGGPRRGERARLDARPPEIRAAGGTYVRSVSCAEDGARRYVWRPREPA